MSKVAELSRPIASSPLVRQDADVIDTDAILKFVVMSAIHLLVGTVQGVMQTFPGVSQWLRESGPAGHLIDPLAHAHINLVGGVTMGMMGLFYFIIPRLMNRPIYSHTLAVCSFWFSTIGVIGFFSSLVILGIIEGNMIHAGMTYGQALEAVGPMHHVLIITFAFLMGFGYWAFITNVLISIFKKR